MINIKESIIFIFKELKHRLCRHHVDLLIEIEEGKLKEPGKEPRTIKIRMIYVQCTKCKRTLGVWPYGIVHDPEKGNNDAEQNKGNQSQESS